MGNKGLDTIKLSKGTSTSVLWSYIVIHLQVKKVMSMYIMALIALIRAGSKSPLFFKISV